MQRVLTEARPSILVVDDELSVREALTAALAARYAVHTAACGAEARAILQAQPIAVIILDALLGDEHGLDLVSGFRKLSAAPIVILTGHSTEELAVRALRAEVAEYLKKPAGLPALHATLERLIPVGPLPIELCARARRYLDEHPPRTFRTADLAAHLKVSETHLRRVFRDGCGRTPRQYLAEARLRRAATLLRTTDHSVKRVALEVGYDDVQLFRRAFLRLTGMSPRAWRLGRLPHRGPRRRR